MNIRYTARAIADLQEIADYLMPRSLQGAASVGLAIKLAIDQLEHFPGLGRPQTVKGVRKMVVRTYPYLVFYAVDTGEGEVVILSIQHAARARDFEDA